MVLVNFFVINIQNVVVLETLNRNLIVETPTSGSLLTSDVCLDCPVEISGRTVLIDLICLPLSQIDRNISG